MHAPGIKEMMLLANCPKLSGSLDFLWLPPTQKGGLREFANNIMKWTRLCAERL
jgi:hypothetical protein